MKVRQRRLDVSSRYVRSWGGYSTTAMTTLPWPFGRATF